MKVFVVHWLSESGDHYFTAHDHELTEEEEIEIRVNSPETEEYTGDDGDGFDPDDGFCIEHKGKKYVSYVFMEDSGWVEVNGMEM